MFLHRVADGSLLKSIMDFTHGAVTKSQNFPQRVLGGGVSNSSPHNQMSFAYLRVSWKENMRDSKSQLKQCSRYETQIRLSKE